VKSEPKLEFLLYEFRNGVLPERVSRFQFSEARHRKADYFRIARLRFQLAATGHESRILFLAIHQSLLSFGAMTDRRPWPAPWVFSLLILPLGISVGFKFTPLPFLLAQAGVPVYRIATVATIVHLPAVLVFFWAPLVDTKLRRRTWLLLGAIGTSLGYWAAFPLVGATHLRLVTALILLAGIGDSLVMASCGGLMVRTLSAQAQAKASAWQEAGQLGGGALGGALVLWLVARVRPWTVGMVLAVLIALPAFVALTIPEPVPAASPFFRGRLARFASEIRTLVRSPQRLWGAVLLISPAGTGAALGLLPAIASHYSVGSAGVMWVNGAAGGVLLALGALCGTLVPGDWDRRLTYAGAALTNAVGTLVLLTGNRPSIYFAGTILYLLTNGFDWARFVALLVEVVGVETPDASTFYSALNAAGAIPLLFMIWLDGFGYNKFGTHGLLWTDAAPNLVVFAIVLIVFVIRSSRASRAVTIGTSRL
jgi:MFS transporter, PAT family, beta-lactamase induction signal transducer AmpG